jgi:CRP-like cAMP-binding protein
VLHVTPSRMKNTQLIVAEPGRQATIDLPTEPPPELRVLRNLTLLGRTRLFGRLPLARAAELLGAAKEISLNAGEQFIFEGADGGDLYVVTGGKCSIQRDGRELKVYGLGDYIGETAVFLQQPRNADVVALTDLELLRPPRVQRDRRAAALDRSLEG